MERHLLLTISQDASALYGARFVAHFFTRHDKLRLTLFTSAPTAPAVWDNELNYHSSALAAEQAELNLRRSRQAVAQAKSMLVNAGFPVKAIDDKVITRKFSKALDIIQEGERGMYDAVVLGRRGLTRLEEALSGSVTSQVMEERITFPVWICRRPEVECRHLLVCVDGSDASLSAVDHCGFMLAQEPGHNVHLLHVTNQREAPLPDGFMARCRETLEGHGVAAQRIHPEQTQGTPSAAILARARQGCFAAVAVGKDGRTAGTGFLGSTSRSLLRELTGTALWLC